MSSPIPVGGEFLVTTIYHSAATITALSEGHFIVAWQDWDGATGTYDLQAQLFAAPPSAPFAGRVRTAGTASMIAENAGGRS